MAKRSAGILMWKRERAALRVLLVHPGGPFWAKKDLGAWTIPKGEYAPDEDALAAARREFGEELGAAAVALMQRAGPAQFVALGDIRQKAGKVVTGFAFEGDLDADTITSNTYQVAWPRGSKPRAFPEVDRAQWFSLAEASGKINEAQRAFLERLAGIP
jgi:predicted NUDIX family NTP pyrophosphohydrolase